MAKARDDALAVSVGPSGTLRLTTSVAFGQVCIVPLIGRFRAAYPNLKLDLVMSDRNIDLIDQRIDLAIRLGPEPTVDMVGAKLMNTRFRVCASPAYLDNAPGLDRPTDLRNHRCVLFSLPELRPRWLFKDGTGRVTEVPVAGDVVISSFLALKEAAVAGVGPALLADWLVDPEIAAGRLVDVLPEQEATATSFQTAAWLLYPSRAFLPNKVRVMIDFLRRNLAGRSRCEDGAEG